MSYFNDEQGNRLLPCVYRAIVVDRNDNSSVSGTPHRGRIQVEIPYLQTDESSGTPHHFWADYCGPSHQFFSIPAVGTLVAVMFNAGNPEEPLWMGAINSTNASKDPPERFRLDEPDNSGYESLGGHFLEFHDKAGIKHIRLEDSAGNYHLYDTELNDLEVFFANDERRTIGRDRTTDIGRDDKIDIGRDNLIDIVRDQEENIGANRTTTVEDDDTLTVTSGNRSITVETGDQSETIETGNKTTDVETGSWINTVKKEYELTGEDRAKFEFTDKIEVITQDNLEFMVTGMWKADVTDNVEWTFSADWTADVTGKLEFTVTDDIKIESMSNVELKNTLFQLKMETASTVWGTVAGTSQIEITPASIILTVGSTTWTMTSSGITTNASSYVVTAVPTDLICHRHPTFIIGFPTGAPMAC